MSKQALRRPFSLTPDFLLALKLKLSEKGQKPHKESKAGERGPQCPRTALGTSLSLPFGFHISEQDISISRTACSLEKAQFL